jgi:hypothetical protein
VLASDTAAFSSSDVTTPVVIRGAGHLNTTITAAVDDSTVQVADQATRTVTDGIADVWNPESKAIAIAGNPDGTAVYEGQDPPNGLVPAPPGSLYVQTGSTSAAAMFLKTIGSDDQGWAKLATV